MKVYVLSEQCDWHNEDPYEKIRVFAKEEDAKKALAEAFEETKQFFADEGFEKEDLYVGENWIDTSKDDYYRIYIQAIEIE